MIFQQSLIINIVKLGLSKDFKSNAITFVKLMQLLIAVGSLWDNRTPRTNQGMHSVSSIYFSIIQPVFVYNSTMFELFRFKCICRQKITKEKNYVK